MNAFSKWLVLLSLIAWGCDDGKVEEPTGGEVSAGEEPAGEEPAGEVPAGEVPAGEVPAGEVPAGEVPAGEVPAGEVPAGEVPAGEVPPTQCADEVDNDDDGAIDLADPGCTDANDDDESDDPEPTTCYERELINLNTALVNVDYVDYDLSTFGDSQTQGSCGGNAGPEVTFKYEVTRPLSRLVFDTEFPETVNPVVLYLRDSCEGSADTLGEDLVCNRGSSSTPGTSAELLDVLPGTYYLFVDTSSATAGPGPFRLRVYTEGAPQCQDEEDNDGDGLVDLLDPGCTHPDDLDETDPDPLPECGDGIDNDGDLLTDYPDDPECSAAGGRREARLCQNDYVDTYELDDEGGSLLIAFDEMATESFTDGCRANSGPEAVVYLSLSEPSNVEVSFDNPEAPFSAYIRSACDDVTSTLACETDLSGPIRALNLEAGDYFIFIDAHQADEVILPVDFPFIDVSVESLITECNDEIDNDSDDLIDLDDPGCRRARDDSEVDPSLTPACADGLDNDEDMQIDYPADQGCIAAGSRYESAGCQAIEPSVTMGMAGGLVSIDTTDLTDNYDASCNNSEQSGPEQMIELQLDQPAQVDVSINNNDFDSILYIRSACDVEEAADYCQDGFSGESLSFLRLERGRYFIFVDGYNGESGTAELSVVVNPIAQTACDDETDNDEDSFIDHLDPGCSSFYDDDESDEALPPACADGVDNDEDSLIDYPDDPGCFAQGGTTESPICDVPAQTYAISQEGATLTHRFIDGGNFFSTECGQGEGVEVVLELTIDELSDIEILVNSGEDFSVGADAVFSLYDRCDSSTAEVSCLASSGVRLPLTPAGTYYVVLERATGVEAPEEDWQISVNITSRIGACNDEEDNDGDSYIDLFDPGCTQPFDLSEDDPDTVPQCFDQLDNDEDGLTDYPDDVDCVAAGDDVEQRRCEELEAVEVDMSGGQFLFDPGVSVDTTNPSCGSNTGEEAVYAITINELASIRVEVEDEDGSAASVYTSLRRRCDLPNSEIDCFGTFENERVFSNVQPGVYFLFVERSGLADPLPFNVNIVVEIYTPPACLDGIDNDEDGFIDLADTGCISPNDTDETEATASVPVCSDGLDNDGDGDIDYPADTFCFSAGMSSENAICDGYDGELRVVTEPTMFEFDTSLPSASQNYTNGSAAGSPEVPFALVVTVPSAVTLEIANPSEGYDAYLHMRAADCDEGDTIYFDDDSGLSEGTDEVSNSPFISIDSLNPGVYYVFMDGFSASNSGSATMIVTMTPQQLEDTACTDEMDNDGDGLVDLDDPGCANVTDDNEIDPNLVQPVCADGIDNDGDNFTDYPNDEFCLSAGAPSESAFCASYDEPIQVITESAQFDFDTSENSASNSYANGTAAASPEIPFAIVLTQPSAVSLEIYDPESGYDAYLHVRATDCDLGETIGFDDDSGINEGTDDVSNSPYLEFDELQAGVYYVFMDGFSSSFSGSTNSGAATMIVGINPIVPSVSECADGIDNDEDNATDLADDGCESAADLSEGDALAPTACSAGGDDDGDGLNGYPDDPDCLGAGDPTDATYCSALPTQELSLDADWNGRTVINPLSSAPFVTTGSCGADIGQPTAIAFTVEELSDVFVTLNPEDSETAESNGIYVLSIREDCDDAFSEVRCENDIGSNESIKVAELLPAGDYILMVEHGGLGNIGELTVDLQLVSRVTECNDGIDNDSDTLIDLLDSGCVNGDSPSETLDPDLDQPACSDGLDNDEDGEIDYPSDSDCTGAGDNIEVELCGDYEPYVVTGNGGLYTYEPTGDSRELNSCGFSSSGVAVFAIEVEVTSTVGAVITDENGNYVSAYRAIRSDCDEIDSELQCESAFGDDVFVQTSLDPGWYFFRAHALSSNENPFNVEIFIVPEDAPIYACSDMIDNDEDSFIDLDDSGCTGAYDHDESDDPVEAAICADGIDNDQDGFLDYPNDVDCRAAGDQTESTRCAALDSVDVVFVNNAATVSISPNQFVDSDDLGSCEGTTPHGEAAVVSFEVPALSDVEVTLNASSFERYAYVRSACEESDDEEAESTEVSCNLQPNGATRTSSLLPAGRYYLHVKRVNALDVAPIEVSLTLVARECADELDNDLDGLTDLDDLGCIDAKDSTENTDDDPDFVLPACGDNIDNDGDELIDYPDDPQCEAAGDVYERETCEIYESQATISGAGASYSFDPEEDFVGSGVGCAFSSGEEAVFTIDVERFSNVVVNVTDDDDGEDAFVYTALRTRCDQVVSEIGCYTTALGPKEFRQLEPGLYFLVVHRSEFSTESPFTVSVEINPIECGDGVDNDEDGLIDADDLGCEAPGDLTENSEDDPEFVTPECADGLDNDMDGETDYPNDLECLTQGDRHELPSCENYDLADIISSEGGTYEFSPEEDYDGIEVSCGFSAGEEAVYALYVDQLSQVTVSVTEASGEFSSVYVALRSECDLEDSEVGCFSNSNPSPRVFNAVEPGLYFLIVHRSGFATEDPFTVEVNIAAQECADGIDNDGDNAIDTDDIGCANAADLSESTDAEPDFEAPQCSDGIDNDMDGDIDYPNEDFCSFAGGNSEAPSCLLYNEPLQIVTGTINFTVDSSNTGNNYTRDSSARGSEVPFVLLLDEESDVTITLNSSIDTYLHMREGVCDDQPTFAYNDDIEFGNYNSQLILPSLAAGTYFVFADGFGADDAGVITVDVVISPAQ